MGKGYNPLALDVDTDEPDFTNQEGTKWWRIDAGDPQDGIAYRILKPGGEGEYVIVKDGQVIYATMNLEFLGGRFDQLMLIRTML